MFSWGKKKEPEIPSEEEKSTNEDRDENLQQTKQAAQESPSSEPAVGSFSGSSPSKSSNENDESKEESAAVVNEPSSSPSDALQTSPASLSSPHQAHQSPPAPPTATTWSEALYLACRSKPTFMQTPRQVLQEQQQVFRPRQDSDSLVCFQKDSATTAKAVVEQLHKSVPTNTTTTTSYSRSVYNGVAWGVSSVAWGVSKVYKYATTDPDDYYDEGDLDWQQEQDEYVVHSNDTAALVPWEEPVVCVQLVLECLNQLRPHCQELTAVRLNGSSGKYSFAEWAANACPSILAAPGLQQHDQDLLVHVLVESGHARMNDDGQYLVFGDAPSEKNVEFAVSLVRLNLSIEASERQIAQWELEKEKCTRRALEKKQRKDINGAKTELAKRNLLQSKIDAAQGSMLNLVQTRDALETSHFQRTQVYESLAAAKNAFAALREGSSVEDADELMLDLRDEHDHVNELSSALLPEQEFDNDELLQELMNLKLDDDDGDGKTVSREEEEEAAKDSTAATVDSQSEVAVDFEKENKKKAVESSEGDASSKNAQRYEQDGNEKSKSSAVQTPAL